MSAAQSFKMFLPAGSEIVINRNDVNQWYSTTKEIDVTTNTESPCPLRNGLPVLTATVAGFQIWFLENQVRVQLPEVQQTYVQTTRLVSLEYDIPAVVSTRPQDYPDSTGRNFVHPSQWMWSIGVRTTLSCWILPKDKIPYRRLRDLTRAGCQWRVTEIDTQDAANHLERAIVALKREYAVAHSRYEANCEAAQERYEERGTSEESQRKRRYDLTRCEKTFNQAVDNVRAGATALGIRFDWINGQATDAVQTVTVNRVAQVATMKNRVEVHCNAVDALEKAGHTAVANALDNGSMPHDIAADYMEDNDVKTDDDGTFSLRDM